VWLLSSETLEQQLRDWSPGSASGMLSSAVATRRAPKSCVAITTQANRRGRVEATKARWSVAQNLQVVECSMTHESGMMRFAVIVSKYFSEAAAIDFSQP